MLSQMVLKNRWPVGFAVLMVLISLTWGGAAVWRDQSSAPTETTRPAQISRVDQLQTLHFSMLQAAATIRNAALQRDPAAAVHDLALAQTEMKNVLAMARQFESTAASADEQRQAADLSALYWRFAPGFVEASERIASNDTLAAAALLTGDVARGQNRIGASVDKLIKVERQRAHDRQLEARQTFRHRVSLALAPLLLVIGMCSVAAFRVARD
jgi:hypothetical protein